MGAILETPDGRVVAIEVQAGATVRSEDLAGLRHLAQRLGPRLVAGYVLYTGQQTLPFGDRRRALPIDALWNSEPLTWAQAIRVPATKSDCPVLSASRPGLLRRSEQGTRRGNRLSCACARCAEPSGQVRPASSTAIRFSNYRNSLGVHRQPLLSKRRPTPGIDFCAVAPDHRAPYALLPSVHPYQ